MRPTAGASPGNDAARRAPGRAAEPRENVNSTAVNSTVATDALVALRRQRLVERLHALGPRVVGELLAELARHHPELSEDLDERLGAYAALDPALLRAVGGDRFAPAPLRIVGGAR